jgi:hypothetical protein
MAVDGTLFTDSSAACAREHVLRPDSMYILAVQDVAEFPGNGMLSPQVL